jgi:cytochrome c oxidase subunit 2
MPFLLNLLTLTSKSAFTRADAALQWQFGFQDPATPIMDGIIRFHHELIIVLITVVIFVSWIILRTLVLFNSTTHPKPRKRVHHRLLEVIWTVIPAFVLIIIAVPSFALLYAIDEAVDPALTLKIVGHQWFWTYEYSDDFIFDTQNEIALEDIRLSEDDRLVFDSYILADDDLTLGRLRLLEVDNRVVLPINTHIRLVITAADVLHCWTIPSFGVKVDGCPGRLNQASLFIERDGVYYGQCSEICGVNHGFIPITVEAVPIEDYISWLLLKFVENNN